MYQASLSIILQSVIICGTSCRVRTSKMITSSCHVLFPTILPRIFHKFSVTSPVSRFLTFVRRSQSWPQWNSHDAVPLEYPRASRERQDHYRSTDILLLRFGQSSHFVFRISVLLVSESSESNTSSIGISALVTVVVSPYALRQSRSCYQDTFTSYDFDDLGESSTLHWYTPTQYGIRNGHRAAAWDIRSKSQKSEHYVSVVWIIHSLVFTTLNLKSKREKTFSRLTCLFSMIRNIHLRWIQQLNVLVVHLTWLHHSTSQTINVKFSFSI